VREERPINADEPAKPTPAKGEEEKSEGAKGPSPSKEQSSAEGSAKSTEPAPPKPKRQRRPIPAALKLIGGTVLVAVVFIVAAIVGGGGGTSQPQGPAPTPAGGETTAADKPADEEPARQAATELGYPAFATDNTTRIGGSDPASNAAAAALAVFPSTTPAQQPAAVSIVDEGDWEAAIAAAVLMAEPVRAPVLFSDADEIPDPTAEALDALEPHGDSDTEGAGAFAIGAAPDLEGGKVTRVGGSGAAAAAAIAALRERLVGKAPAHVVVAPSGQPGFAMPAAAWAARSGDPVLFAAKDTLPEATVAALKLHPKLPVFVLGPPTAISDRVLGEIDKLAGKAHRVSGKDPVANAVAFSRYANGGFGWNINDPGHGFVVARSDSPLDAAAAAPLSAAGTWGPLLLTDSADTLPAPLRDYLLDVKPGYSTDPTRAFYNHVWLLGDLGAIDVDQQAEINSLAELAKIGGGEE
jgi:hypothetical protein